MSLILSEVVKQFDEHLVVNRVSLDISEGELFVLLGSSGSGKSTILRLIAGLLVPDQGTITLRGDEITSLAPQKRGFGFVFQNYALFRHMTVSGNVEFGLRIRGVEKGERQRRVEELLDLVGLTGLSNRYPAQLSGGQRQRVALARALAYNPSVLLLDEPFGALDVTIRSNLRKSLLDIQKSLNITTVLVTHDQEEAFELGQRIGVLEKGRLVEVGTPRDLYHQPKTEFVANFIGGGNVLVGRYEKGSIRIGETQVPLPPGAPRHEEGAPVRILFRPEAVIHGRDSLPSNVHSLESAKISSVVFSGSYEKIRFELEDIQGVRHAVASLQYGQQATFIDATQVSTSLDRAQVGEVRKIGFKTFHVLQPTSLRILAVIEPDKDINAGVVLAGSIAHGSHGILNLVTVVEEPGDISFGEELLNSVYQSQFGSGAFKPGMVVLVGEPRASILLEAQAGYYDIVVISRTRGDNPEREGLGRLSRQLLDEGIPVLISGASSSLTNLLICTAGGEQGKGDVRLGARIARHTGANVSVFHVKRSGSSEKEETRVRKHLEQATKTLSLLHIPSEVVTKSGPLIETILNEVRSSACDLIVMGFATGGAPLAHDPVRAVVTATDKPILIVPERRDRL